MHHYRRNGECLKYTYLFDEEKYLVTRGLISRNDSWPPPGLTYLLTYGVCDRVGSSRTCMLLLNGTWGIAVWLTSQHHYGYAS